jgi:hypothetical protein
MSPNVRKGGVWVGWLWPDQFLAAPHKESVAGAGQGIFPPAKPELTTVAVEVGNLRVPAGLAEPLAVLAFKECLHG